MFCTCEIELLLSINCFAHFIPKSKAHKIFIFHHLQLGISKIFNLQEADLGDMLTDDDPELHVSSIAHKAFIDVNEKGTEACGITYARAVGGGDRRVRTLPIPKKFIVERPFFYAIESNGHHNLPLFCGSLRSPSPAIKNERKRKKAAKTKNS